MPSSCSNLVDYQAFRLLWVSSTQMISSNSFKIWFQCWFMCRRKLFGLGSAAGCRLNPIYSLLCQSCCSHSQSEGSERLLSDGWTVGVCATHFCNFPKPTNQQPRPLFTVTRPGAQRWEMDVVRIPTSSSVHVHRRIKVMSVLQCKKKHSPTSLHVL